MVIGFEVWGENEEKKEFPEISKAVLYYNRTDLILYTV